MKKLRPGTASSKPGDAYLRLVEDVRTNEAESEDPLDRKAIASSLGMKDTILRALRANTNMHNRELVELGNIPNRLSRALLSEHPQETFIQESSSTYLACYSPHTIATACAAGMVTIIADGVHGYEREVLGGQAQIYTAHGVCPNGAKMAVMTAFTGRKTTDFYRKFYNTLHEQLMAGGVDMAKLTLVVDFEKAAHKAILEVFPSSKLEGCLFHFARACNRKRVSLLDKFREFPVVEEWQGRLKALAFLPEDLHEESRVLKPPVGRNHPARSACVEYLDYFQSTWKKGIFAKTWNKFGQTEHRTSNIAEGYHNALRDATHHQTSLNNVLTWIRRQALASFTDIEATIEGKYHPHVDLHEGEKRAFMQQQFHRLQQKIDDGTVSRPLLLSYLAEMSTMITRKT